MANAIVLIAALTPFVLAGLCFWHDPRQFKIGILLLTGLSIVAGIGFVSAMASLPQRDDNLPGALFLLAILAVLGLSVLVLIGALLANGATMLAREAPTLGNLLSLFVGLALLGYLVLGTISVARNDATMFVWLAAFAPIVGSLGFTMTAFLLYGAVYRWWSGRTTAKASTVVVLGARVVNGAVTPLLAARLDAGAAALHTVEATHPDALIVVSGGQGPDEDVSEASAMRSYLIASGTDPQRILCEDESATTEQNLRNTWRLLNEHGRPEPILVATSDFHTFRAALLMRRLGIPGQAIGGPTSRYYRPSATLREFIAVLRDNAIVTVIMLAIASSGVVAMVVAAIGR